MAEECVSVYFEDGTSWDYCWEDVSPYPDWDYTQITTGLRSSTTPGARAWRTCQYYLKGMPTVCNWWTGTSCSFITENNPENPLNPPAREPSGFNYGSCDFLGRRSWCSSYEAGGEYDPEKWICTAPNPYLTGFGKRGMDAEGATFIAVSKDDIWGYNDAGDGVGQCDCHGWGRGAAGCAVAGQAAVAEKNLSELPIICNHYRPYQLGYGIISPSPKFPGDVEADGYTITSQGWERAQAWEEDHEYRLPLSFELYNERARLQKCQWWSEEVARRYEVDSTGTSIYLEGDPDIFDDGGKVEFCVCPYSECTAYNTRILEDEGGVQGAQLALDGVWAKGGGPVCNGARPECPYYSGKWIFLTGDKMLAGMPVTANQIMELRFWSSEWDSQEDYDAYFSVKPNFDDPATPAIYTFTKWFTPAPQEGGEERAEDTSESKMKGKKIWLCQPAPLHQREFTKEYIQFEEVEYFPVQIGTSTETEQRHYPSLVRNDTFPNVKPLTVVYPPYNNDYFDDEICKEQGEPGYIKRSNNMAGDYIKSVGQTVNTKRVYVINTAEIFIDPILKNFPGVYAIRAGNVLERPAESIRQDVYNILREAISRGFRAAPDYINFAISDDEFGFFIVDNVKLRYNKDNLLLIAVDLGDGTWEYRWRLVLSKWYGGIIKQTEYLHKYEDNGDGWDNKMPEEISPGGTATASLVPLGGTVASNFDPEVINTFSLDDIYRGLRYFAYSYVIVEEEDSEQSFWGAVGNTNKILLELEDKNINYVYEWAIMSAELVYSLDSAELPAGTPSEVELKTLIVDDNHMGAAMVVFEPADPEIRIRFLNSEWALSVTYRYRKLTNDPSEGTVVYGGGLDPMNIHNYGPASINNFGSSIEVSNISKGSAQMMAHFKDENNRIIAAFATKLLVQIIREQCRGVDIEYRYSAEGRQYVLEPASGFCINVKQDIPLPDPYKHVEVPNCGDHLHSWQSWEGPMWFPYNVCRGYDMYDEFTICNNCQAGYVGPLNDAIVGTAGGGTVVRRADYRYCGPYKYDAFGAVRGNWAAACDCGCKFWYSDASAATVVFDGRVYKRTTVDLAEYAEYGWYPPPFGNEGRELVEKYVSQDYITHLIPFIIDGVAQKADWMPLMLDHSVFFASFNAYDDNPEDEYVGISPIQGFEPFRYVHQLTMGTLAAVSEEMAEEEDEEGESTGTESRQRWDELFDVHHEGNCSYPLPAYPVGTTTTKAVFYYLKPEWGAWAWQENWKSIERNFNDLLPETEADEDIFSTRSIDTGQLDFMQLEYPTYIWDYYKAEHRRVPDEGGYQIEFVGPQFDGEGNMTVYPTISIDGANPRPFEILYPEDSYISTNEVAWQNEGSEADTQGAAGDDNIYEKTLDGDWLNDEDIIYDSSASATIEAAAAAGRKLISGKGEDGYTYKYYNKGLIVKMTRDRLYQLPKQEEEFINGIGSADVTPDSIGGGARGIPGIVWDAESVELTWDLGVDSQALSRMVITGIWGYAQGSNNATPPRPAENELIRPGVSVTCDFTDGSSGTPRGLSVAALYPTSPVEGQKPEPFAIYMDFLLGPVEMIQKRATAITLRLRGQAGAFISLEDIVLYSATYVDIRYENIKVWERKYRASKMEDIGTLGINLDGPGDYLHYQEDLLNMGQYFPFRSTTFRDKEVIAMDKTKVVSCGIHHPEDERVVGVSYDNLHDVEATEQRDLYEYAYNIDPSSDQLYYNSKAPYRLEAFLTTIGENWPSQSLVVESHKLGFEDHWRFKEFKQYAYWRPGGHYYTWDDHFRREKCMLFGPPEDVFSAKYIHVDHQGIGNPLTDASTPVDPGNSYYSLRFYTQQAKYDRAMILAGGEPEYTDKWGIGGGTFAGTT